MLPKVGVGRYCCAESTNVENYRPLVGDELIDEILSLGQELKGVRVCQINATAGGGGVAELLERQIPIYRALGIDADWRLIFGDKDFFNVTKSFHNALQGAELELTSAMKEEYLEHNQLSAEVLEQHYDVYVVHDPQPAAIRALAKPNNTKWIWRCHIDSSQPNLQVWNFLRPYLEQYDATVFTMQAFCPDDFQSKQTVFIPPAIDPFSTKNMELPDAICRQVIANSGVSLRQPILLQVSRFDPWKDPLGVIEAYRLVKQERPDVQLVLIGAMAGDDPEGWEIHRTINEEALKDEDLYVFTNMTGVGSMVVNAFQRGSDLIIQKSLREGFGLVVSEALWKRKPIVAGRAGGIPMQFPDDYQRYLVDSVEECGNRLLELLDAADVASAFGQAGHDRIREQFLLPRLIRDELRLLHQVLNN